MAVINAASMGMYGVAWESAGYGGNGNVAPLIGSISGHPAIIAGGARTVFDDMRSALDAYPEAKIFAVNDIGMFLPVVHHWVSLHGDHLGMWKNVRWLQHRAMESAEYHCTSAFPYINWLWDGLRPVFCLSGYFAMQIAWIMGASPIILCGCPGSSMPRFFDLYQRDDFGYGGGPLNADSNIQEQVVSEMVRVPDFKKAVRSMSGWTKEFFGGING